MNHKKPTVWIEWAAPPIFFNWPLGIFTSLLFLCQFEIKWRTKRVNFLNWIWLNGAKPCMKSHLNFYAVNDFSIFPGFSNDSMAIFSHFCLTVNLRTFRAAITLVTIRKDVAKPCMKSHLNFYAPNDFSTFSNIFEWIKSFIPKNVAISI